MSWRNTTERYGSLSIGLHWLMLLLIAAVYALMEFRDIFPRGSDGRETMKAFHYMLGLSVLLLALFRLAVAVAGPMPGIEPAPSKLAALAARAWHMLLYGFMIAMPIVGWVILSAEGDSIPFWGLQLPALVGESHDLAEELEELHELGANIGYALVAIHAAAALFHHYIARDNTLQRMLPRRGSIDN
jgi:cytochrome b561